MEKRVADLLGFLEQQDDIIEVDINSDIEQDFGSFSLSGLRITSREYIYPAALGFDLGCGVGVFRLQSCTTEKIRELQFSSKTIFGIRRKKSNTEDYEKEKLVAELQDVISKTYYGEIEKGNHFLEIQKSRSGDFYVVVHSGLSKKIKEQFESFFIDFYHKYVEEDPYGDNGYVVKVPSKSEDGRAFWKVCYKANQWTKMNRNYIATEVGKKIGCTIECFSDTSHEYLLKHGGVMVHSNGVQLLMERGRTKVGIVISDGGCNNYLISGKKGTSYINHGTRLKQQSADGKRVYGDVEELMNSSDFSKRIEVLDVLTPIINCKKTGREYEYTVFRK